MADVGQEEVRGLISDATPVTHSNFGRTSRLPVRRLWLLVLRSSSWRCAAPFQVSRILLTSLCTQDLKREFVTELIYPAVQANCIYEVR